MQMSALREKCWDCHQDVSGDKPTLVARLATIEVEKIEAELNRIERTGDYTQGKNRSELNQSLQLAIVAKADQVYNVKKQYLLDEVEEIKAELASIKEERDEERIRGMKRYNRTESLTKENGKAVIAQHKKFGLGQERVADREGGELASGGNSTIADTKVNPHPEIYYIPSSQCSKPVGIILLTKQFPSSQSERYRLSNPSETNYELPRSSSPMTTIPSRLPRTREKAMEGINFFNILGRRLLVGRSSRSIGVPLSLHNHPFSESSDVAREELAGTQQPRNTAISFGNTSSHTISRPFSPSLGLV
jgi:hypothetical protein